MESTRFNTPVLFLIFNRPDTTERVFQRIRAVKPSKLFVSADGPRQNKIGEEQKCTESRKIIDRVDWQCDVKTNFSEKNLGCRAAVSSGIDWFFQNVEEGIILEDDCLPDLSFFTFCEILLDFYRNDSRIMHIGGANFQDGKQIGQGSYYFSSLCHVWGWATWKRAWSLYDVNMKSYPDFLTNAKLHNAFATNSIRKYWKKNFDLVYEHKLDTWDYQWQYAVALNNGLTIIPNKNLISNIGFDNSATHTVDKDHSLANRHTDGIYDIVHPPAIQAQRKADIYTFKKYASLPKWKKLFNIIRRIIRS